MATMTESAAVEHELQPVSHHPPNDAARGQTNKAPIGKLLSAGFSFFVAGVNDGSIGALLPYIIREYHVSRAIVSALYAAQFFGWFASALVNTHLVQSLHLGVLLALGAGLQAVAHALRCWNPPFALFVVTFFLASLGQAFQDTHGNTFVADCGKKSHRWLAFIHAMYMAGCLVGPFVSTAVAGTGTEETPRWFLYYVFPLGLGIVNLVWCMYAFRDSLKLKKRAVKGESGKEGEDAWEIVKATLTTPSVWLLSAFFFFYLGAVLTAGGWVVEYLVDVRHGELSKMGYVPAGFNGGCLLGRLLLAEPTHRFGPRRMVFGYILAALGLQLIFWLVPNIIAASIAISFFGFFTGPLFATGISLGSKLFPLRIQSNALALVFVFAQMGGSLFPIVTGVVSSNAGVQVLQPILVGLLAATAICWLCVPREKRVNGGELHEE